MPIRGCALSSRSLFPLSPLSSYDSLLNCPRAARNTHLAERCEQQRAIVDRNGHLFAPLREVPSPPPPPPPPPLSLSLSRSLSLRLPSPCAIALSPCAVAPSTWRGGAGCGRWLGGLLRPQRPQRPRRQAGPSTARPQRERRRGSSRSGTRCCGRRQRRCCGRTLGRRGCSSSSAT